MQSNREVFQETQEQEAQESPDIEREEEREPIKRKRTILDIRSDAHIEAINRRKRGLYKNLDLTKQRKPLDLTILDENGIYRPTEEDLKASAISTAKSKKSMDDEMIELRQQAKLRKECKNEVKGIK